MQILKIGDILGTFWGHFPKPPKLTFKLLRQQETNKYCMSKLSTGLFCQNLHPRYVENSGNISVIMICDLSDLGLPMLANACDKNRCFV